MGANGENIPQRPCFKVLTDEGFTSRWSCSKCVSSARTFIQGFFLPPPTTSCPPKCPPSNAGGRPSGGNGTLRDMETFLGTCKHYSEHVNSIRDVWHFRRKLDIKLCGGVMLKLIFSS